MKSASISDAKNRLSALLDQVRAGETILILDRGTPIARIEPVSARGRPDGRLDRLERAGVIRRSVTGPAVDLLREDGPRVRDGVSVVDALLEERRSGR